MERPDDLQRDGACQYFLLENLTIYHTWSALTGIATNVGLAWWLMPRYGISGAALGALIGYFVSAFVTSWMFGRLRECALFQTRAFLLPSVCVVLIQS
ncbi:MAG: polysaccharide biosynthesis C-terminal domain-containing protein [Betaproteobacteria bacterium]|nr:polysaccharide biosynthesis C-terminal domain-containing protein [Betaproteobacteria bacterium]